MAYLTTNDIEAMLNITLEANGVTLVNSLIEAVSEYVDSYCGRTWSHAANDEITEYFDGDTNLIKPTAVPVASIVYLKDQGNEISSTNIFNYGNYIKLDVITSGLYRSLELKYKTAATSIPKDLKGALVQWVSQIFKAQGDGGKVASRVTTGPVSVDYATKDGIPKYVEDVMRKYRLVV